MSNIELKKAIHNAKGFNHQNLRYAEKFYTKYKKIFPQVVGELKIADNIITAAKKEMPSNISTSCGISGINGENQVHFLLADTPDEFKDNILKLIHDEKLREKIGSEARIFVENNYSWKTSMTKLDDIISNLIT